MTASTYPRMFWKRITDEPSTYKDIELSCRKLLTVKGFPRDLVNDFIHSWLVTCALHYGEYDESLSGLKTWMINWARATVQAYIRRNRGKLNPFQYDDLSGDSLRVDEDNELDDEVDRVADEHASIQISDEALAVRDVIRAYVTFTKKDFADHCAVVESLHENGFTASVQLISDETGLSVRRVRRLREEVILDLQNMLIMRGVQPDARPRP